MTANLICGLMIKTSKGQALIELYYGWNPARVKGMEEDEEFRREVEEMINGILPMIKESVKQVRFYE